MTNTPTTRHDSTETTASADWRREYAANAVPLPDGGRRLLPTIGARVGDREDDDAELLVLDVDPAARADEWRIDATGQTVAEHNPEYAPDSPVVVAVYAEDAARLSSWRTVEDLRDAVEADAIASYSFPVDRLTTLGGDE